MDSNQPKQQIQSTSKQESRHALPKSPSTALVGNVGIKSKLKNNIQLIVVIAFIVLSLAVSESLKSDYSSEKAGLVQNRTIFVESKIIEPKTHRVSFKVTGNVEARGLINITTEISGRITNVSESFFSGGSFKKGEVLFKIDPRDFQFEVERLEAEVAKAKTSLNLELAESKSAIYEWNQINKNRSAPDLVARKPQLAEAESNLKSAQAQLKNAKLDLERTKFTLPFSGKVVDSTIALGQYIAAGQSYGTVFDAKSLEVKASLEDSKLQWLINSKNPEIKITTKYLGKTQEHLGQLKRSASSMDTSTRFAAVRFGFLEKSPNLLPGIFADIEIKGEEIENALLVPSSALQDNSTMWQIIDNKLAKIDPEIIYSNSDYIVMKGQGQKVDVVVSKISGATEGMVVKTVVDLQKPKNEVESGTN
jgi:RND family efflux transporter MFP subunit